MSLLDEVKVALRVSSGKTDAEISAWIAAAKADMARVGIAPGKLSDEGMDPLCKSAVLLYVKGMYGFDNEEAPRFLESYRLVVAELMNSPTSYAPGGGGGE